MKDIIQKTTRKYKRPHIRVWVHPKSGKGDYYYEFNSIVAANHFIETVNSTRAENTPLIAYDGLELTIEAFRKRYPKVKI